MIKKLFSMVRRISRYHLSVYAGNSAFFMILSIFPLATLLLGLFQYLPIDSSDVLDILESVLPEAAYQLFHYIFGMGNPTAVISISAVVTIWSASRGALGILKGLNRAYHLTETRNWFRVRIGCIADTLMILIAVLAALLLYVFGKPLTELLEAGPLSFLVNDFTRFLVATAALILLFALVYRIIPDHKVSFRAVLPGALFSGLGWMIYSWLFSIYITHFSDATKLYGSLHTITVTMLWLYVCTEILFLGAILNYELARRIRARQA